MRINVIPVKYLSDVHLLAEYREINMAFHYFRRSQISKGGIDLTRIPSRYTLNTGHAYFFYNKFNYILKRAKKLKRELSKRKIGGEFREKEFTKILNNFKMLLSRKQKPDTE